MDIGYINSYTYIETDFKNGLDNIGSVLASLYPDQTIQALADAVYNYAITTYMAGDNPNPLQARSLKSAIYAIINGYINIGNGDTLELNSLQSSFAFELVNGTLELRNPEGIKQHISNIEERITTSPLSVNEQTPLLYATAIGKASYDYWANTIANLTPANPWVNFINSFTPPIVKFPTWIASAMQGTLIGLSMYQNRINGSLAAELRLVLEYVGANTLLSLFGSLGVGAGKVVFNLQQREVARSFLYPDKAAPKQRYNSSKSTNKCNCNNDLSDNFDAIPNDVYKSISTILEELNASTYVTTEEDAVNKFIQSKDYNMTLQKIGYDYKPNLSHIQVNTFNNTGVAAFTFSFVKRDNFKDTKQLFVFYDLSANHFLPIILSRNNEGWLPIIVNNTYSYLLSKVNDTNIPFLKSGSYCAICVLGAFAVPFTGGTTGLLELYCCIKCARDNGAF